MSSAPCVLIVDDDPAVRGSILAYLQYEGFILHEAGTLGEAVAIVSTEPIDVAIVDVQLREATGEQVIVQVHAIRPTMRFLIHTGAINYELPPSLAAVGMTRQDVLYKPIPRLSIVVQAIRRLAGVPAESAGQ